MIIITTRQYDRLADADEFVCLETETPLRMLEAIVRRQLDVQGLINSVHRLEEVMGKVEVGEKCGIATSLRINQLEFATGS